MKMQGYNIDIGIFQWVPAEAYSTGSLVVATRSPSSPSDKNCRPPDNSRNVLRFYLYPFFFDTHTLIPQSAEQHQRFGHWVYWFLIFVVVMYILL